MTQPVDLVEKFKKIPLPERVTVLKQDIKKQDHENCDANIFITIIDLQKIRIKHSLTPEEQDWINTMTELYRGIWRSHYQGATPYIIKKLEELDQERINKKMFIREVTL